MVIPPSQILGESVRIHCEYIIIQNSTKFFWTVSLLRFFEWCSYGSSSLVNSASRLDFWYVVQFQFILQFMRVWSWTSWQISRFGSDSETASTVVDRRACANCIPSIGFGFGPTFFAGFEISCAFHKAIKLNFLGNFGIRGWFWTDLDSALDRGDWELLGTGHGTQKFIVVVQNCLDIISCRYMSWMNLG